MKILIDFTQIPLQKNGVGVYAYHTFESLLKNDNSNQYVTLIQNDDSDFASFLFPNNKIVKINSKYFRRFIPRVFFEQVFIPVYCILNKVDIIHSLHYSFPLFKFKQKQVVTIHDLTFFLYPKVHTLFKRYYFRLFIYLAGKFANEIICVSQSTANDLFTIFPKIKANVSVIPLAVKNEQVIYSNSESQDILNKFNIQSKFILFIGTLEPRKNIENLIRSFDKISISNPEIKLVLVGRKGWFFESMFSLVNELRLSDKIIFTGFVTENEKFLLLSKCDIFVYPSIYEGFGLPILEAFVYQKPTISSSISSIPEVAGDAAILINPSSVEELAQEIDKLLNDKLLYNSLIPKMKERLKIYSWYNTANKTKQLYNKLKI
ncbi:MAG: glycosyltransferase family 1 protein [Paludibacter sp.]|nr:glycosyltransferase family 1 protein [Paludibacter sp.]